MIERKNRLSSSNFGKVCKRRSTTLSSSLVKQLVYPRPFSTSATEYGKQNEDVAIRLYEAQRNCSVQKCGLFVDLEYGFLAASPDGIVQDTGIAEVKCPASKKDLAPEAAAKAQNPRKFQEQFALHQGHDYYYQIQGQFHITKREFCDSIVYTEQGIHIERIMRDDDFWAKKMEPFLLPFYTDCMLPEIVDPRETRSMPLREPKRIMAAIQNHKENLDRKLQKKSTRKPGPPLTVIN
ncbi:uncharacterized protein LOC135392531 [Ornithodoros turicata]|uniref:uncharacterized protein LOC135392531 n=1 Tax=Ornithodoros turicata TaxID=34597 RepID=UPI00313863CC